jgi:hypothetical protein
MGIEAMRFADIPESLKFGISQNIQIRFNGLISVWNYWLEHSIKYISFTNAGGIVATLTFINSRHVPAVSWAGLALLFFVIGLLTVGIIIGNMFNYAKINCYNIQIYFNEFYKNSITWGEFLTKADELTKANRAAIISGWIAAFCFFIGLIVGIITYLSYGS